VRNYTPSGKYNSPFGRGMEKFDGILITGTTASVANEPLINKPRSGYFNQQLAAWSDSEGVYVEDQDKLTEGFFFPNAETTVEATTSSLAKCVKITETLTVTVFLDGTALDSRAQVISASNGSVSSQGTVAPVNAAATLDFDICRLSDTQFAVSYLDDGGDDYLAVRIGTVTAAGAITFGVEKELNAAALKKGAGTCISLVNTLTIFVGYVLNADGKGLGIAATFTIATGTVSAPGTAVEFDGGADTKELSSCSHTNGDIAVVYQAGGDANDPITMCCGTVSAAKVIVFGDEVTMAGAAVVATGIDCVAMGKDIVAFCWVDSTYLHVNSATIALTVPTKKTETQLTTTAALAPKIDSIGGEKVGIVYEDDANANDVGKLVTVLYDRTLFTFTIDYTSQFTQAAVEAPCLAMLNGNRAFIAFEDAADSDKVKVIAGDYSEHLIDIRSKGASKAYRLFITPAVGRKRKA